MMRRMDALLSGLVGAVVGALVGAGATAAGAWLVAGRQIDAQERAQRQEVLRGVLGDFLAAVDRLWRAEQALGYAVFELTRTRRDLEVRQHAEDRRQAAFAELRPARHEAEHALGLLRILYPALAHDAEELRAASERFMVGEVKGKSADDYTTERQAALEAFERAARVALQTEQDGTT